MKNFKKIISAVCLVCVMTLALSGCAITKKVTLATVENEVVSLEDFHQYFEGIKSSMLQEAGVDLSNQEAVDNFWDEAEIEGKNALVVARERALNEYVKLIVQNKKAKEMNITLTEEDKKQIDQYKTALVQQNFGSKAAFLEQLKAMKTSEASYDKTQGYALVASKLYAEISKGDEYKIDREKAKEALKESDRVTAKHILFSTVDSETQAPLSDEKKQEAKKLAEETLEKIKNGANFDSLMKELSQDPGLATSPEGYTFGKGEMVKPFEEASFNLKENEVSEIVESDFGYHIIKRLPLVIEETDIDNQVAKMQQELYEAEVEKWKADYTIDINEKSLNKIK